MVQHIKKTLALLAAALLIAGCSTTKVTRSALQEEYIGSIAVADLPAIKPDTLAMQHLTSNIKLELGINGDNIDIKGKLRIKRGEGIQISITPLGLMEAACIEFLPDRIRLINKLFKTYTEMPYSEAKAIGLAGINYNVLESIFLNRVFLTDGRPAHLDINSFKLNNTGNGIMLTTGRGEAMLYSFLLDKSNGNLISSSGISSTGESIRCDYSAFKKNGNVLFPNSMCITFKGDIALSLGFEHSKLSEKAFKFTTRNISGSYRKQSAGDFIKSIK